MEVMVTPCIYKVIIFDSLVETNRTNIIFLHLGNVFEFIVFVLRDLANRIDIRVWLNDHHLTKLLSPLLYDSLFSLVSTQGQQVISPSHVGIDQGNCPAYQKHLMKDKQKADPKAEAILQTKHAIDRMVLRFLPESDTHEHVAHIDQANGNHNPPIGHVMLIYIDCREFVQQEMLKGLSCVKHFVDLKRKTYTHISRKRDREDYGSNCETAIEEEKYLVDKLEYAFLSFWVSHQISIINPLQNEAQDYNQSSNGNWNQQYYQLRQSWQPTKMKLLLLLTLLAYCQAKCSFQVGLDNIPVKLERDPFKIEGMTQCVEYNGQMGCCDAGNDQQQSQSFTQLDGVFSSLGGGCDVCAINLKRFWCEYACSPKQSEFTDVEDGYFPIPNPQKPGEFINAQKITIRVQAQTACDLFNACNRNQFVSAVSAMSTPAGFLTFQGHNAVNDALQYMEIKFSYNKSNSIYFGNDNDEETGKVLHNCNTTTSQKEIHGFPFFKNCTCNNCGTSCKDDQGFIYSQSSVFEDFNYILVGATWAGSIIIASIVTMIRNKNERTAQMKSNSKKSK